MIEASKSLLNRALIVQSYFPGLKIEGDSTAEDVQHLKKALKGGVRKKRFNCGEAGTVLRFLAFRVAREQGRFSLSGSRRLFLRPQKGLYSALQDIGSEVKQAGQSLTIYSQGWRPPHNLKIEQSQSSQFISGILLNAWNLPHELQIQSSGKKVSDAYLQMTIDFLKSCGMQIKKKNKKIVIPKAQKIKAKKILIEPDMSSAFAYCANLLLYNDVSLKKFPKKSLQPDFVFLQFLKKMGLSITQRHGLKILKAQKLKPLNANLNDTPDLFPVLAALCGFASGKSYLRGAEQLVHKESNRLQKTSELLVLSGIPHQVLKDGMIIEGQGLDFVPSKFTFDPDRDHRMAMAAALFKGRNNKIKILTPQVVKKSYPDFWKDIGMQT